MPLIEGINIVTQNVSVSWGVLLTFLVNMGGLVFFAKDFKLGITLMFLSNGLLFMYLYNGGFNYAPAVILFFMSLVMLALSLYPVNKAVQDRGFI